MKKSHIGSKKVVKSDTLRQQTMAANFGFGDEKMRELVSKARLELLEVLNLQDTSPSSPVGEKDLVLLMRLACNEIRLLRAEAVASKLSVSQPSPPIEEANLPSFKAALDLYCKECGAPSKKWTHASTCSKSSLNTEAQPGPRGLDAESSEARQETGTSWLCYDCYKPQQYSAKFCSSCGEERSKVTAMFRRNLYEY
jgi:Zn finger protein HypA/HybF involved in hydrogenase expression